jgi:hypothetical protein
MPELTTVPSFVFYQGEFEGEGWELPIEVGYYNGCVSLGQQGNGEIILSPVHIKALFKEVLRHLPEAEKHLKEK